VFADDTMLPVLAPGRGRTKTGRLWCYAVDNRPWCGPGHPAGCLVYSEDRKGEHPQAHLRGFRRLLQVDGYAGLILYLDDGRLELDHQHRRARRAPGCSRRKNALFAGADNGGRHWATIATLIQTAKLNDVEPSAWLTDALQRIVARRTKLIELASLLPSNWKAAKALEAPGTG
jgi:hypothetical protein